MELCLKNIKYHRDKDSSVSITEAQALTIIGDVVTATLAQNGFTAEVEVKE